MTFSRTNHQILRKERHFEWASRDIHEKIVIMISFVIFALYSATLLFAVLWVAYNSLKTARAFDTNPFSLPDITDLQWSNYAQAWKADVKGVTILEAFWNSIWMSFVSVVLGLLASSMTAYVVAKYHFRGSKIIYAVAVFIQIIPLVGGVSGFYKLVWSDLQIANDPFLIWPMWFGGFGFSFLILVSAFKSIPWDYAESAFVDGAGHFRVFWQIMLPMVRPVLASLFIVNMISAWSEYMTSYLYLPDYPTLAFAVYELSTEAVRVGTPLYFAIIIIAMLPTLILFTVFQKMIMENTTTGGLKG
jgi:ABC-type glycerol-3-phosphate transport system permease component